MLIAWGAVLAVMNCIFYSAIDRLPLGTVAAIEFLPVIVLAAIGMRTPRNLAALAMAVAGVYLLTDVVLDGEPLGVALAAANAVLFALYIVLGAKVAERGAGAGIDALAASMLIAAVVVTPIGGWAVLPALGDPVAIAAGIGVGVSSSVIPYVSDQLALARMTRSTYALMVSLLPATATVIGIVVLGQLPTVVEVAGRRARRRRRRRPPRAGLAPPAVPVRRRVGRRHERLRRRATSTLGSWSATCRASASPNASSSPSTVSARIPKAVGQRGEVGRVRGRRRSARRRARPGRSAASRSRRRRRSRP